MESGLPKRTTTIRSIGEDKPDKIQAEEFQIPTEDRMSHLEILVAVQMLFLNSFAEPLCKQVHDTLVSIYRCLLIKKKALLPIVIGVEDEAQACIIRKHIVLATCAMFYNHE